jgi:cell division protein FtsN
MAGASVAGRQLARGDDQQCPLMWSPAKEEMPMARADKAPAASLPVTTVATATPAAAPVVSEPIAATVAADGEHYIHVSSFRTAEHAAEVARQFTEAGLLATVRRQLVRDVQWHRVYLGPFATHDDAVRLANHLREQGTITYYKVLRLDADEGS